MPRVQRFAPKLVRSLERAIDFCQSTLSYGRAQEAAPDRRRIPLDPVINEVRELLGACRRHLDHLGQPSRARPRRSTPIRISCSASCSTSRATPCRRWSSARPDETTICQIRIAGKREGSVTIIEVSDSGPGVPEKAREHLFEAFQSSARRGGTGLGLTIAAELVRAHGGQIRLVDANIGATFRIEIPDRPVDIHAPHTERVERVDCDAGDGLGLNAQVCCVARGHDSELPCQSAL